MPSSVRSKDAAGGKAPMSERQQMALLMQMTSTSENLPRSPGGTSYTRHRDRNERGETPLHLAAIKGDIEQVSKLLAHRADPNVPDFAGWTPLHEACNYGWYEIAFKLVQAGANVNAKGLDNDTPLHDAAINGHVQLIKLLVERGADINAKNAKGKTPLDSAHAHVKPYLLDPDLPVSDSMVPSSRLQSRTRDEKKITDSKKSEDLMEANKSPPEDPYEFKTKESSPDQKSTENDPPATDPLNTSNQNPDEGPAKRNFSEVSESTEEPSSVDDESKKKKRKDETVKEGKNTKAGPSKGQCNKQTGQGKGATANTTKATSDKKSPCPSPKVSSDAEDDSKSDLKVPPLKIVIPQTTSSETETGGPTRSSKSTQRTHQALPYVVPSSNSSDSSDKDPPLTCAATVEEGGPSTSGKSDEKKDGGTTEEQQSKGGSHQRVLRSSHRGGQAPDRSGSTSSPPLQRSHSPSPSASPSTVQTEVPVTSTSSSYTVSKASDTQATTENETTTTAVAASPAPSTPAVVELHPRKRKMKPKEQAPPPAETTDTAEPSVHPHDQPITNCYQMYRDIRKQIEKRRKGLFPVQPKPPQGFKDYLMNRCTYVLAGTTSTTPNISFPPSLQVQMKDLFTDQEKERYRLRMQHVIEKEKLVLSVEQEILRVHGRAARALANQHLPFSVCSILRDEEVYNLITPEQEEKDRNARSRYNGRLFLSWLQDVDDKWEKIKEHMLLRHHNEAESLHAVQKMDWEWKMKELSLCDRKITPTIDDLHVPMVHVSDDFDLLPA